MGAGTEDAIGLEPVSQEISLPGKIVAEAKFPRIFGRPNLTERPYFLGNIAAPRKFCRLGLKVLI